MGGGGGQIGGGVHDWSLSTVLPASSWKSDKTFFACCEATRHYLVWYGSLVVFYSDKHGVFRVDRSRPSGWSRSLGPVWVNDARIGYPKPVRPQTLQGGLVKEVRLREIVDSVMGNLFLPGFGDDSSRRFVVTPSPMHLIVIAIVLLDPDPTQSLGDWQLPDIQGCFSLGNTLQ